jgi:ketosteroid isomerase-like protein
MSDQNVQIVRKAFDAFTGRDVDAAIEVMDPAVELYTPETAALAGESMPYKGHDGIRRYFEHVNQIWEELEVILREYHDVDDHVLVVGRVRARGRDGRIVDTPAHWAWRIDRGSIVWGCVYTDRAEALAAVGMSE